MIRRDQPVEWHPAADPDLPWEATVDGERWQVRLNDVRTGAPLYSLLVGGAVVEDFQAWPECWKKVDPWEQGIYEHAMEKLERMKDIPPSRLVQGDPGLTVRPLDEG